MTEHSAGGMNLAFRKTKQGHYPSDGIFGRLSQTRLWVEVLRFRLMIDVVCLDEATSIRWRSAT
jgi:hypothetical protein